MPVVHYLQKYHLPMKQLLSIRAEWDPEARVWVATSEDVPGLATEAETIEQLESKLQVMIPELLEPRGLLPAGESFSIELLARRITQAPLPPA